MTRTCGFVAILIAACSITLLPGSVAAYTPDSTRVEDASQYAENSGSGSAYREKADYVLKELDLKPGDVAVDIGAGDGFWAEKMAAAVGPQGAVYAGEVSRSLVDKMKRRLAAVPQAKPYLCPTEGTGLAEDSCDLAFLSKTYHHLPDAKVEYLEGLKKAVKPTGRLVIVERYRALADGSAGGPDHAWPPGLLTQQAEQAGWILLRYELMNGTGHYIAIFVQRELFGKQ